MYRCRWIAAMSGCGDSRGIRSFLARHNSPRLRAGVLRRPYALPESVGEDLSPDESPKKRMLYLTTTIPGHYGLTRGFPLAPKLFQAPVGLPIGPLSVGFRPRLHDSRQRVFCGIPWNVEVGGGVYARARA
jgi:hypothetical protein